MTYNIVSSDNDSTVVAEYKAEYRAAQGLSVRRRIWSVNL
jgi:hypothetical protein